MDLSEPTPPEAHVPMHGRGTLARGAWFGLLTQAVDKFLPVLITLYLARALEPADFGVYAFIIAYLALFQTATEYGLDTVMVRLMSQSPALRLQVFQAGLGLKVLLSSASALVATLLVVPISGGQASMGLMLLASLGLVTAMGRTYRAYYRATIDIKAVFIIASIRAFMLAIAVVAAVMAGAGLGGIFAAMASANLLAFIVVAIAERRRVPVRMVLDRELWARLLRGVMPLVANALAMTVSLRAGQILLISMRGPVEVGLLGAASRVAEAFTLLPEALMITVYPVMAGLHASDNARLLATVRKSTRYLVVATGVPVVICAVAGTQVMETLFGADFAQAGPVLAILGGMALLSATGTVILNLLVAVHREGSLFRNTAAFAVVNVLLSLVLIRGYGFTGAAIAMVATSLASQISLALLPSTGLYVRTCLAAGLRAFLAVAAAAGVALAFGHTGLTLVGVALAVYVAALVVLGVVNRDEIRFVRSLFAHLSGSAVEGIDV